MLLDPVSWGLTQRGDEVLALAGEDLAGRCAAETHEAALELRTGPHATVREAIAELRELRSLLVRDLARLGMAAASCGTHPGPMNEPTRVSPSSRYQVIYQTTRDLARREPTFALHVHVGVPDPQRAIRLVNQLRAHLPLLLGAVGLLAAVARPRDRAWRRTGRSCSRASRAPGSRGASTATGTGSRPSICSLRSGAIPEPTFLWWDVRPQPRLGTVEVRIMDAQPRLARRRRSPRSCRRWRGSSSSRASPRRSSSRAQEVLAENRFIAARDATAAELIDPVNATLVRCRGCSTKSSRPPDPTPSRSTPSRSSKKCGRWSWPPSRAGRSAWRHRPAYHSSSPTWRRASPPERSAGARRRRPAPRPLAGRPLLWR